MMIETLTTEQAILKTMETPEGRENAFLCYYESDVSNAYQRFFSSEEWRAVRNLLKRYKPPSDYALDLGAGNGIGSFALSNSGFSVTSLEPDLSELVGSGATNNYKKTHDLPTLTVSGIGESLPFKDQSFGLVYCRQVLHHASDLIGMLSEVKRVLLPKGIFLATREHIVDDDKSLKVFLDNHSLHKYTQAERAFKLDEYLSALSTSGLRLEKLLLSKETVINFYPTSNTEMQKKFRAAMANRFGSMGLFVSKFPKVEDIYRHRRSIEDHQPGRMISFVAKNA